MKYQHRVLGLLSALSIITYLDGAILNVLTLETGDGKIQAVRIVSNPDKLGRL